MAWRIALLVWGAVGTVGLVLTLTGGTVSQAQVVDGLAGIAALAALWLVVKVPWDLYFAARNVQKAQADSDDREIEVRPQERAEASRLARRLLGLAVGLHLAGAGLCALAAQVSDVGLLASAAFLLSMALRPTTAMVVHVRRRLAELQGRAVLPRVDARDLGDRLEQAEVRLQGAEEQLDDEDRGLAALEHRLQELEATLDRRIGTQEHRFRSEMDRVCVEFERSVEKVSRDQELLAGVRAFLAMVRQPA